MAILIQVATGIYAFQCPACGHLHQYWVAGHKMGANTPVWDFNGDLECPTFTPSLLNTWGKQAYLVSGQQPPADTPDGGRCHLFVTNGWIHFCGDCTHTMSGKSIPMESLPQEMVDRYEQWDIVKKYKNKFGNQ